MNKKSLDALTYDNDMFRLIKREIEKLDGKPKSGGMTNLQKHLKGERLTARQAIIAKCCDCMGYYIDGREDCEQIACPLYGYMPYNANRKAYIRPDRRTEGEKGGK